MRWRAAGAGVGLVVLLNGVPGPAAGGTPPQGPGRTWRDVTQVDILMNLVFTALPPDHGVVTPIAEAYQPSGEVGCVKDALASWSPGMVEDPLQRSYNLLYVAAVPDVLQMSIEAEVPLVVFERLISTVPRDTLIKVLYWVATHPSPADASALDALPDACLNVQPPADLDTVHERVGIYAAKLLGRLIGAIEPS